MSRDFIPIWCVQHPQLMSGEDADERKANVLKQSLDYLDIFLESNRWAPSLRIFSIRSKGYI